MAETGRMGISGLAQLTERRHWANQLFPLQLALGWLLFLAPSAEADPGLLVGDQREWQAWDWTRGQWDRERMELRLQRTQNRQYREQLGLTAAERRPGASQWSNRSSGSPPPSPPSSPGWPMDPQSDMVYSRPVEDPGEPDRAAYPDPSQSNQSSRQQLELARQRERERAGALQRAQEETRLRELERARQLALEQERARQEQMVREREAVRQRALEEERARQNAVAREREEARLRAVEEQRARQEAERRRREEERLQAVERERAATAAEARRIAEEKRKKEEEARIARETEQRLLHIEADRDGQAKDDEADEEIKELEDD